MNTVLPIGTIIRLGALCAAGLNRFRWPLALRAGAAALAATLVWVAATCLMMWATAPNELGVLLSRPVLLTYLTALAPAVLVAWRARPHH